jgi:hypothetical protein
MCEDMSQDNVNYGDSDGNSGDGDGGNGGDAISDIHAKAAMAVKSIHSEEAGVGAGVLGTGVLGGRSAVETGKWGDVQWALAALWGVLSGDDTHTRCSKGGEGCDDGHDDSMYTMNGCDGGDEGDEGDGEGDGGRRKGVNQFREERCNSLRLLEDNGLEMGCIQILKLAVGVPVEASALNASPHPVVNGVSGVHGGAGVHRGGETVGKPSKPSSWGRRGPDRSDEEGDGEEEDGDGGGGDGDDDNGSLSTEGTGGAGAGEMKGLVLSHTKRLAAVRAQYMVINILQTLFDRQPEEAHLVFLRLRVGELLVLAMNTRDMDEDGEEGGEEEAGVIGGRGRRKHPQPASRSRLLVHASSLIELLLASEGFNPQGAHHRQVTYTHTTTHTLLTTPPLLTSKLTTEEHALNLCGACFLYNNWY